ncbi:hypothetical protein KJ640_01310 [bacterium]|nr:hypothetical protein [bacterium]
MDQRRIKRLEVKMGSLKKVLGFGLVVLMGKMVAVLISIYYLRFCSFFCDEDRLFC